MTFPQDIEDYLADVQRWTASFRRRMRAGEHCSCCGGPAVMPRPSNLVLMIVAALSALMIGIVWWSVAYP